MRILTAAILSLLYQVSASAEALDFNRDVRPILSENCFHCHGADAAQRQADLRLDVPDDAIESGAISPGKPNLSLLVERIRSTDPNEQMPPPDSHRALTPPQIEMLARWVEEGAHYDKHWAFKAIERPALPGALYNDKWLRNDVDRFVLSKLNASGLDPSPRAPMPTLLRRLSLDLTGLPASAEQLARWQQTADPIDAAIDELLSSPHYGERMATEWLDVARYADTHGFNNDAARTMWPWRDWVITALNENMPYDQFITAQLAGDLLPHATRKQRLATGFNRNHVINSEGGIIDEEYRVEYVADRVRTTSLAWLGLTLECARCHDHKFDPITQREYYQFFAFFNNVDETGEDGRIANAAPLMSAPSADDQAQLRELKRREAGQLRKLRRLIKDAASQQTLATTHVDAAIASPTQLAIDLFPSPQSFPDGKTDVTPNKPLNSKEGWALSAWTKRQDATAGPLISTMNYATPRSAGGYGAGAEVGLTSNGEVEVRLAVRWPAYATRVISRRVLAANEWGHVAVVVTGNKAQNVRIFVDGIESATIVRHDGLTGDVTIDGPARVGHANRKKDKPLAGEIQRLQMTAGPIDPAAFESTIEGEIARFSAEATATPRRPSRSQALVTSMVRLSAIDAQIAEASKTWRATHAERLELERTFPHVMVVQEMSKPRKTFVLQRGQYNLHGEEVLADVPQSLGLLLPHDAPRNRLTLARWFTDPRHPLTARVVMNRLWQQFFGVGLVKSSSDFGMQSEWPSHPELLDSLAAEFIASGWDLKHMVRLIVESATYQQDSSAAGEMWARDPENRLLARGPRQRLSAEMIRDHSLAVSGLLNPTIGGPPAYPYQPADYYKGIVVAADYPGSSYTVGSGGDLYRRSLYTFWKRTVPHPTLASFDSPDREFCVARRSPTNTPLQALALMNDPTFLEAARKLGERMLTEGGPDDATRLAWGFRTVTAREPTAEELTMLRDLLAQHRSEFADGVSAPQALLDVGAAERSTKGISDDELAAYASLGSLLLNLDETINRN